MADAIDTTKSCASCVFRITPDDALDATHEDIGVQVCGRGYGPLAHPMATASENLSFMDRKGAMCVGWEPRTPGENGRIQSGYLIHGTQAFKPDDRALKDDGGAKVPASSCMECVFVAAPSAMEAEGHWPVTTCTARGILLERSRLQATANSCAVGIKGRRSYERPKNMVLAEPYSTLKIMTIGELDATPPAKETTPVTRAALDDPTEYITDQEVSDDDKAHGIRAWRIVTDPSDKRRSVMLPVFDINFFNEDDRAAIPRTGDDEHPEEYIDHLGLTYKAAVLWTQLNETPALWGVAGTGKTEFYRYMAWLMCLPFNRISVTGSTEVEDLAGKMHYEPTKGTYFEYGRIPNAWQKPGVICLDEPNVGQPDVWQFIRPLTDNSKQLVLDMNNGERISRHTHAFLGMAMNPAWDVRNSGTASLADADGSRLMHIYVELPNEETERGILASRVRLDGWELDESQLDLLMGVAKDLRRQSQEQTLSITWGIRPQIKVARALRWFSATDAYRLATVDYLDPAQQNIILDVVKSWAAKSAAAPRKSSGKAKLKGSWETAKPPVAASEPPSLITTADLPKGPTPPPGLEMTSDGPEPKHGAPDSIYYKDGTLKSAGAMFYVGKEGQRLTSKQLVELPHEHMRSYMDGFKKSDDYKAAVDKRSAMLRLADETGVDATTVARTLGAMGLPGDLLSRGGMLKAPEPPIKRAAEYMRSAPDEFSLGGEY